MTGKQAAISKQKDVFVVVTAHPDDESMFFLPTLGSLQHETVWLLCLTTGNYGGLGRTRSLELKRVCDTVLSPIVDKLILIDDEQLPDHPTQRWSIEYASSVIQRSIKPLIRSDHTVHIITFDKDGVSGHVNHRDVYRAVQHCAQSMAENIQAWSLETVHNPIAKYIPLVCWCRLLYHWFHQLFNAAASSSSSYATRTDQIWESTLNEPLRNWRAMATHYSQWVWYRKLFVFFSCYTYFNRLHTTTEASEKKKKKN